MPKHEVIDYPKSWRAVSMREIKRGDTTKKQVIFTFDGGSGSESVEQILMALAKHHVKGSFFLTGQFAETFPALTRKIVSEGHEVFNHTYDHPHLPLQSNEEIHQELRKMEMAMKNIVNPDFHAEPYFRAPYGDSDHRVILAAFNEGYQSVGWTVDAGDWMESEGVTAADVKNNILSSLAPGNIYLMHLGDYITGSVLDEVLSDIESRGYKVVSLTEGIRSSTLEAQPLL
ncbi:MAG: polysaccharide deacetylase family protein [Nanoarchaeota archaeon]|nr:polysaccharide deacetylase family protein [Nanoarchaeota archaeon]